MTSFAVEITPNDWVPELNGWRCDALALPGAAISGLKIDGEVVPEDLLKRSGTVIRWAAETPAPNSFALSIKVEDNLATVERNYVALLLNKEEVDKQIIELEKEKLYLEQRKAKSESNWKLLSALASVIAAAIGVVSAWYFDNVRSKGLHDEDSIARVTVFEEGNDFLNSNNSNGFKKYLSAAKNSVWLVSSNFHISTDRYRDQITQKIKDGVSINYIMMDPYSESLDKTAKIQNQPVNEFKKQSFSGIATLNNIIARIKTESPDQSNAISVRLISDPILTRMYVFDPRSSDGVVYLIPQIYNQSSMTSAGFLIENKGHASADKYFVSARHLNEKVIGLKLDQWLELHKDKSEVRDIIN